MSVSANKLYADNVPCLFYDKHVNAAFSLTFPAPKLNLLQVRG